MDLTYVVTVVLLLLAPLAWRKGWHKTGVLIVVLGFLYALTAQPWMQDVLKGQASAWLTPQQGRWNARLGELERALDELRGEVQGQREAVDAQAGRLEAHEAALTAEQEARLTLEGAVTDARRAVTAHEAQLATLGVAATDLASGVTTESFDRRDARRIARPAGRGRVFVYLQLAEVPRPETLTVRWSSKTFTKEDTGFYKNIALLRVTTKDAKRLSKQPLSVSYVPDSARAGERAAMVLRDGEVVADGQRLVDVVAF